MPLPPKRQPGLRRDKLIVPGDNWDLIVKASKSIADVCHLELEDGIVPERKQLAREMIVRAGRELDWGRREIWIRVNGFESGLTALDVDAIVAARPSAIILGKTASVEQIHKLDALIGAAEQKHKLPVGEIQIAGDIERIWGLHHVEDIAMCSPRMGVLIFGIEDMANEYGWRQARVAGEAFETYYCRSRIVLAARLAGIQCIDSPFLNFRDAEGSAKDAQFSAQMGFDGKTAISPRQLADIHKAFMPSPKEIAWAKAVLAEEAALEGTGKALTTVGDMFVDKPHFIQARAIMDRLSAIDE